MVEVPKTGDGWEGEKGRERWEEWHSFLGCESGAEKQTDVCCMTCHLRVVEVGCRQVMAVPEETVVAAAEEAATELVELPDG